jgi:hypothetical protein
MHPCPLQPPSRHPVHPVRLPSSTTACSRQAEAEAAAITQLFDVLVEAVGRGPTVVLLREVDRLLLNNAERQEQVAQNLPRLQVCVGGGGGVVVWWRCWGCAAALLLVCCCYCWCCWQL